MRRRGEGFKGVMEFLIGTAALDLQKEGAEFVSLSGAPLAQANPGEEQVGVQKLLEVVGKTMEPVYGFRSLLRFKAKFQPVYQPMYMCYPGGGRAAPDRARHLARLPAEHDLRSGRTDDGPADLSAAATPPLADIAAAAAHDAGGLEVAMLADFLPELVGAVGSGNRVHRRDLARYHEAGRSAAQAGVALRALVDLYLSAAWRLWRHLPEVIDAERNPAAVVQAGEVMLRAADDVVAALTEGYQLARRDLVSTQVAARREFVDDLLSGGTQALAGLVERAGLFGLSLVGPHAVLIVQAEQPFTDSSPLTRMLERSIMGAKADADALVSTKDGALVVVFAAPDRRAVDGVISGLEGQPAE